MSENYLYKIPSQEPEPFPSGTYQNERHLLETLREFNRKRSLPQEAFVHVYETDATPLGIGRKYLGRINVGRYLWPEKCR